jgi:hypothetical protein
MIRDRQHMVPEQIHGSVSTSSLSCPRLITDTQESLICQLFRGTFPLRRTFAASSAYNINMEWNYRLNECLSLSEVDNTQACTVKKLFTVLNFQNFINYLKQI